MTTNRADNASNLLQFLQGADPNVAILDWTNGLFGDLYSGTQVFEALLEATCSNDEDENVGVPKVPTSPISDSAIPVVRSLNYPVTSFFSWSTQEVVSPTEIAVEVHNTSDTEIIRVRWIDNEGAAHPTSHLWDLPPHSTLEQYSQPGHFFLISLLTGEANESQDQVELLLGAYRPKRVLPSMLPHMLMVEGAGKTDLCVLIENLLTDDSRLDALCVVAADIEHQKHDSQADRRALLETVSLLQTIIRNVVRHPDEEKYHKLRLSNKKFQKYLVGSTGATELLRMVGFVPSQFASDQGGVPEDYLVLPTPTTPQAHSVSEPAGQILELLHSRLEDTFVPELASPTPWQPPLTQQGASHGWQARQGRGFISAEERWERAERVARNRRSGAARRPNPGEAPSSKGKWGR